MRLVSPEDFSSVQRSEPDGLNTERDRFPSLYRAPTPDLLFSFDNFVLLSQGHIAHMLAGLLYERGKRVSFLDDRSESVGWTSYITWEDLRSSAREAVTFVDTNWPHAKDAPRYVASDFISETMPVFFETWRVPAALRPDLGKQASMYRMVDKLADPEKVALDIGAHHGRISRLLAERSRFVYAFEPLPENQTEFKKAAAVYRNICLIEAAAGSEVSSVTFYRNQSLEAGSIYPRGGTIDSLSVPVTTIDTVVEANGLDVGFIKIDAEDHDLEVIRGGLNTIERQEPVFVFEMGGGNTHIYRTEIMDRFGARYWFIRVDDLVDAHGYYARNGHTEMWHSGFRRGLRDDGFDILAVPKARYEPADMLALLG